MSMLFGGGRPPTHQPVPPEQMMRLARVVAADASAGAMDLGRLEATATREGVPTSHVLAAAAAVGVVPSGPEPTVFELCAAGCQAYGSLECLDALLRIRAGRQAEGKPTFHVRAVGCMNGCMQGPICRVQTPDGAGFVMRADPKRLEAAVTQVLDEPQSD